MTIGCQKRGCRYLVIRMRQKTSDEKSYVEKQIKLFENEDAIKKASKVDDDHPSSSSFPLPPFMRSFSSSSVLDISAYNNVTMDVLDVKTMLLKMKRLLEQVTNYWNRLRKHVTHSLKFEKFLKTLAI